MLFISFYFMKNLHFIVFVFWIKFLFVCHSEFYWSCFILFSLAMLQWKNSSLFFVHLFCYTFEKWNRFLQFIWNLLQLFAGRQFRRRVLLPKVQQRARGHARRRGGLQHHPVGHPARLQAQRHDLFGSHHRRHRVHQVTVQNKRSSQISSQYLHFAVKSLTCLSIELRTKKFLSSHDQDPLNFLLIFVFSQYAFL